MDNREVARDICEARRSRSLLPPPSRGRPDFSIADGYAVGELVHQEQLDSGWLPSGFKLGFTNQAIWGEVGLDCHVWAHVYDESVTGVRQVSLANFVAPRIEPEIVVGLGADVDAGAPPDVICGAIDWAAMGFEIVQCHFPDWQMTPADAIADGGLHGVLVVGDKRELSAAAAYRLAEAEVVLCRAEEVVSRGRGSAALGGPVDAVAWLLREIRGLEAGAVITTGTLTPAFPIKSGETWRVVDTGPDALGELQISFS